MVRRRVCGARERCCEKQRTELLVQRGEKKKKAKGFPGQSRRAGYEGWVPRAPPGLVDAIKGSYLAECGMQAGPKVAPAPCETGRRESKS